jgi:cellulose synthase/poly-beta-1,6-N-acetylglucosamine synthase-like glycosyltransferase
MFASILHLVVTLAGIGLLLLTLPLFMELLLLSLAAAVPSRRRHAPAVPTPAIRLAVIIPAHNEQELIGQCVRSVLAQATPDVTVCVVAHNCTDSTAQRAQEAGAQTLTLDDTTGGKGTALDFGFRHALDSGAEAVLVIDADSIAGPGMIDAIAAAFAAGAEALQCRYVASNAKTTQRTRLAALALLGMNVLRPLGRSRLGVSCGIFGNGFALSSATLARAPYVANSLVEDLEYHLHLLDAGISVRFLDDVAVYGEMPENSAAAASQRARWEGGRVLMRRTWTGPLLRKVLSGRLNLVEPLVDLLAFPLATEVVALLLALGLAALAHLLWLELYALTGLCSAVLYLVVSASLAPDPWQTLRALLSAPAYVFWKLLMIPRTRRSARPDSAWIRTRRNTETGDQPETK